MMVLVDTSVWIDHLRNNEPLLTSLLTSSSVLSHPFVRGELALGNLSQRQVILSALDNLPQAPVAFADEVNLFIETHFPIIKIDGKRSGGSNMNKPTGNIVIYQTDDGQAQVEARFEEETVWLGQA